MLSGNRLPRNVSTPPMATSRSLGVRDQRPGGSTWKATTCVSFYASVCVWACVVHVIAEQSGYEWLHHCIQRSVCRHVSTHCGKILVVQSKTPAAAKIVRSIWFSLSCCSVLLHLDVPQRQCLPAQFLPALKLYPPSTSFGLGASWRPEPCTWHWAICCCLNWWRLM